MQSVEPENSAVKDGTDNATDCVAATRAALSVVEMLLRKSDVMSEFRLVESARSSLLDRHGVPAELSGDILQLITRIPRLPSQSDKAPDGREARPSEDKRWIWTQEMVNEWHQVSMEPFRRIRRAYILSMIMSAVLFIVGIALFAVAVERALLEGTTSSETLLIAGIGTVDFIALIYTRPLKDIAVNLTQAQRAGILAMTFHAGLPLIKGDGAALDNLERLTNLVTNQANEG